MRLTIVLAALAMLAFAQAPTTRTTFEVAAKPMIAKHCVACHAGDDAEARLDLDALTDERAARAKPEIWAKVRERVLSGEMPPAKKPRPSKEELDGLVRWIDASFFRLANGAVDPGRPTLRRLNRGEYERTVRDLFGVEIDAAAEFPSDDVGYGFDNVGDVLASSDVLLEKYLAAAEKIAGEAVVDLDGAKAPTRRVLGGELDASNGNAPRGTASSLYSNSVAKKRFVLPRAGQYAIRVHAWGDQAGPEKVKMGVQVDGKERARFDVAAVRGGAEDDVARLDLAGGAHVIGVAFLNDYYKPEAENPAERDRNLLVEWVEVEGPLDAPILSPFQRRWLADAKAPRERVLAEIGKRAWRRPLAKEELARLAGLTPADAPLTTAVRTALVAMLVSPYFLFRVEDDARTLAKGGARDLDDWELATRLAYFVWGSAPDDELTALCDARKLHEDGVLAAQVARMLRDPRASSLAQDFAVQWLQIRALERTSPDPARFPRFDEDLRRSMRTETELFFDAILREDRPVSELLLADFTFLDEALARHYGVPGVHGPQMRRVRLERGERNGLLGQGSILTVTSNPTRTSPVKRGKWVLDVLLGAPPPPPPPGVGDLNESAHAVETASLRERMLQHRKDPSCASCHARLDPLGFGLEGFDAIGARRERDGAFDVDAAGEWPDGRTFRGAAELREQIAHDPRFVRTLAKKLLVYALGRGLGPADEPSIDAMLAPFATKEPSIGDLVLAIARSEPFRRRRVESASSTKDMETR